MTLAVNHMAAQAGRLSASASGEAPLSQHARIIAPRGWTVNQALSLPYSPHWLPGGFSHTLTLSGCSVSCTTYVRAISQPVTAP